MSQPQDGTRYRQLALLTDAEVELCLHSIVKRLAILDADYEVLVATPLDLNQALADIATQAAAPNLAGTHPTAGQRAKMLRAILVELSDLPTSAPHIDRWLADARPTLLEPVTTALVLAGIIAILSTDISVGYDNIDGKKKLKVRVHKSATASKVLEKFFDLMH